MLDCSGGGTDTSGYRSRRTTGTGGRTGRKSRHACRVALRVFVAHPFGDAHRPPARTATGWSPSASSRAGRARPRAARRRPGRRPARPLRRTVHIHRLARHGAAASRASWAACGGCSAACTASAVRPRAPAQPRRRRPEPRLSPTSACPSCSAPTCPTGRPPGRAPTRGAARRRCASSACCAPPSSAAPPWSCCRRPRPRRSSRGPAGRLRVRELPPGIDDRLWRPPPAARDGAGRAVPRQPARCARASSCCWTRSSALAARAARRAPARRRRRSRGRRRAPPDSRIARAGPRRAARPADRDSVRRHAGLRRLLRCPPTASPSA